MFKDRIDAGKKLSYKLLKYKGEDVVVLSIPRGGVIVAYEIAKMLNAKIGLIFSRKIGAPFNPELAIGAISENKTIWLNNEIIKKLNISNEYIKNAKKIEFEKINKMKEKYKSIKKINLKGKIIIITDDGIATGATIKAAAIYVKKYKPKKLILAFPVGPKDVINELKDFADEIICLETPEFFNAVGEFYENFKEIKDEEIEEIIKKENL